MKAKWANRSSTHWTPHYIQCCAPENDLSRQQSYNLLQTNLRINVKYAKRHMSQTMCHCLPERLTICRKRASIVDRQSLVGTCLGIGVDTNINEQRVC